jgi:hypothetical protein
MRTEKIDSAISGRCEEKRRATTTREYNAWAAGLQSKNLLFE